MCQRRLRYPMWAVGRLGLWEIDDAKLDGRWPEDTGEVTDHG